jgi:hypothetical protein
MNSFLIICFIILFIYPPPLTVEKFEFLPSYEETFMRCVGCLVYSIIVSAQNCLSPQNYYSEQGR